MKNEMGDGKMKNEFLPIGTIVMLENCSNNILIVGTLIKDKNINKLYDYVGCLWPEGAIEGIYCFFNNQDIKKIIFEGYKEETKEPVDERKSLLTNKTSNVIDYDNVDIRPHRPPRKPNISVTAEEMIKKYGVEKSSEDDIRRFLGAVE